MERGCQRRKTGREKKKPNNLEEEGQWFGKGKKQSTLKEKIIPQAGKVKKSKETGTQEAIETQLKPHPEHATRKSIRCVREGETGCCVPKPTWLHALQQRAQTPRTGHPEPLQHQVLFYSFIFSHCSS